jgi:hypothetical protein
MFSNTCTKQLAAFTTKDTELQNAATPAVKLAMAGDAGLVATCLVGAMQVLL